MTHDIAAHFAPFEERMRQAGLSDIVIDNFRYYYGALAAGETGVIPENTIDAVPSVVDLSEIEQYIPAGETLLPRAAVLKLNGGLGTSMGLDKAKSLLVARDGLSFLDIIVHQNMRLNERYASRVPLLFMNSFSTDADTREVLARYPSLAGPIPSTMMQNKVPKILRDSLQPAVWLADPDLEWCPPGHGEVYVVLATTGMLDTLLDNGYEYLFISNADNLGATLDPGILGYISQHHIPFLMEVADRTEADKKGGHIARLQNGQLVLREIAQCPPEDLPAFQDTGKHRFFNTNNIWVDLVQLKQTLVQNNYVLKLPMIRNAKTLDPRNTASPGVFQLETAMGSAISVFPNAQALRTSRERFLPVKLCQDLLTLRSDIYTLDEAYRLRASLNRQLGPIVLDLDSRYYRLIGDFEQRFPTTPSLVDCAQLTVQGDVVFESGIALHGHVQFVNASAEQRHVPAGTAIADSTYELKE